jgi:hypothetical protein
MNQKSTLAQAAKQPTEAVPQSSGNRIAALPAGRRGGRAGRASGCC